MKVINSKYKIIKKIGSGGQAEVYLAEVGNEKFGFNKKVAIKFFDKNETNLRYFKNEVSILSKLSHKNICSILDVGESDDKLFLVLEYFEGINLKEFSNKIREKDIKINENLILFIGYEIQSALNYLHKDANLLHRDISLHNVIINLNGEVKLIDFGISVPPEFSISNFHGRIDYSPDFVLNDYSKYDRSADFYSLGILLLKLALSNEISNFEKMKINKYLDSVNIKLKTLIQQMISFEEVSFQFVVLENESQQILKKVIDSKVIVDNTIVLYSNSQSENHKWMYILLALLIVLISTYFIFINKSDFKLFSFKEKHSEKLLFPTTNQLNKLAENKNFDLDSCNSACYQTMWDMFAGQKSNYDSFLKLTKMPKTKESLDLFYESGFTYFKNTYEGLDVLNSLCPKADTCQKITFVKNFFDSRINLNQSRKNSLSEYIKTMNEKSYQIDRILKMIFSTYTTLQSTNLNTNVIFFNTQKISNYIPIIFKYKIDSLSLCRKIGDYAFLNKLVIQNYPFKFKLDSEVNVQVFGAGDNLEVEYSSNISNYQVTRKSNQICSYSRSKNNITFISVW